MIDKRIQSLANQVAELKKKSPRPRYPQTIWDQVKELRLEFTTSQLAQLSGIDLSSIYRKTGASKNLRREAKTLRDPLLKKNSSPQLIPISPTPLMRAQFPIAPVLEMELASGVKIRIFA
jgi:hypothetical protein